MLDRGFYLVITGAFPERDRAGDGLMCGYQSQTTKEWCGMREDVSRWIDNEANTYPEAFGVPAGSEDVQQAEATLAVTLPADYRLFLRRHGAGAVGNVTVYGLSQAELEFVETPSFVDETLAVREELSDDGVVVIGRDVLGNPIGFDLPDETVVRFIISTGEREVIADNFETYLLDGIGVRIES